jgi:hypothetical protein
LYKLIAVYYIVYATTVHSFIVYLDSGGLSSLLGRRLGRLLGISSPCSRCRLSPILRARSYRLDGTTALVPTPLCSAHNQSLYNFNLQSLSCLTVGAQSSPRTRNRNSASLRNMSRKVSISIQMGESGGSFGFCGLDGFRAPLGSLAL